MKQKSSGILYLIPTPLGAESDGTEIALRVRRLVSKLDGIIAESKKSALAFLKQIEYPSALQNVQIRLLNEHTRDRDLADLIAPLERGENWGLVSDAGSPAVADPGAPLVRLAHLRGVRVSPQPGPSAVLLALMASGLTGQRFAFHGYLSKESAGRRRQMVDMESDAEKCDRTQIWMETPYRNQAVLEDALAVLRDKTLFCVAAELTLPGEEIRAADVGAWKKNPKMDLRNRPAIFLLR